MTVAPSDTFFTGKERDAESDLDYFGARYYNSTKGRFMSPDWAAVPTAVPFARFGDPQSLNLYTYVEDSPLTMRDLNGHGTVAGELGLLWQRVKNEFTGNGFQTDAQHRLNNTSTGSVTDTETYSLPPEAKPNELVALGADVAALFSAAPGVIPEIDGAIPGAPAFGMGLLTTGVSVNNDSDLLNLSTNAASTILGTMSTFGTGVVASVGTGGGFVVAVEALAWDGSKFTANNVIIPVFTPDASQSNTINANGITMPSPDAYDWHQP